MNDFVELEIAKAQNTLPYNTISILIHFFILEIFFLELNAPVTNCLPFPQINLKKINLNPQEVVQKIHQIQKDLMIKTDRS